MILLFPYIDITFIYHKIISSSTSITPHLSWPQWLSSSPLQLTVLPSTVPCYLPPYRFSLGTSS